MSELWPKYLLIAGSGLILLFIVTAHASDNPHVISKQNRQTNCVLCHIRAPVLTDEKILTTKNLPVDLTGFVQDGVTMCSSCHNPTAYHKIGLNVDFPVPADLPLNQDKEIICLTCHYAHGRLDSDRPQASFSFMDRLLNGERLHKSFLLRRNNTNGELCLTCHNPS